MQTNEIVRDLIEKINSQEGAGTRFLAVYAHEYKVRDLPIDKAYIAFLTDENKIGFFENNAKECCKRTTVSVRCDFIFPKNGQISQCYALAEGLLDALSVSYAGKLSEYKISKAVADNDLKSFRLPCVMKLVYEQCPAQTGEGAVIKPFADFFCKSHVNDKTSHLTSEEKQYINSPFVVGHYGGTGEQRLELELGFRPKLLFVFASGSSGIGKSADDLTAYFGFAASNRATKGLEITQNGFAVEIGDDIVSKGVYSSLNYFGITYNYAAFK